MDPPAFSQHRLRDILRYPKKKNPAFMRSVATKINAVQLLKLLLLLSQRHLTQWNLGFFWTDLKKGYNNIAMY